MTAWKGIVGRALTPADFLDYVHGLTLPTWRPRFVVLHNTGIPTFAEWHAVPGVARIAALERYYRDDQGWSGGPHLFIADDVIWTFTPLTVPGVHAPSWNAVSWGVEMVGDYEREPLSSAVFENTASALATLHDALGLDPATLRLHKEDPLTTHTSCPGFAVDKQTLISAVRAAIAIRHAGEHRPDLVNAGRGADAPGSPRALVDDAPQHAEPIAHLRES